MKRSKLVRRTVLALTLAAVAWSASGCAFWEFGGVFDDGWGHGGGHHGGGWHHGGGYGGHGGGGHCR